MAEYTKNYNLEKQQGNEYVSIEGLNKNFDTVDAVLGNAAKFEKAGGTATAIALTGIILEDGTSKTFIVSFDNDGAQTTINDKGLYKPGTETAPNLIAGKAATVWYDQKNDCFFIKASAEGTAVADNVLAGKTFSNEYDSNISGKMPDYSAYPMNGGYVTAKSVKADGGGNVVYEPPTGYYKEGVNTAGFGTLIHNEPQLVSANIKGGSVILGIAGKASVVDTAEPVNTPASYVAQGYPVWMNGQRVLGTTPVMGNEEYYGWRRATSYAPQNVPGRLHLRIPVGMYLIGADNQEGQVGIFADSPDWLASNILNTANIFGLQGTAMQRRYASGTTALSTTPLPFYFTAGTEYFPMVYVTVSGLIFTPRTIIVKAVSGSYDYYTIYDNVPGGNYTGTIKTRTANATHINNINEYNFICSGNAYVTSSGFRLPMQGGTQGGTAYWEAYE